MHGSAARPATNRQTNETSDTCHLGVCPQQTHRRRGKVDTRILSFALLIAFPLSSGFVFTQSKMADPPRHGRFRSFTELQSDLPCCSVAPYLANTIPKTEWVHDDATDLCRLCSAEFTITKRRHHCRRCGQVLCADCTSNTFPLDGIRPPSRVCDLCHYLLNGITESVLKCLFRV